MLCSGILCTFLLAPVYLHLSWPFGISVTSVHELFHETLEALYEAAPKFKFPAMEEECVREACNFSNLAEVLIDFIIGAFESIAIEISQLQKSDRAYVNE